MTNPHASPPDGSSVEDVLCALRQSADALEGIDEELDAESAPAFPVQAHRLLTQELVRIREYAESIGERAERDWSRS